MSGPKYRKQRKRDGENSAEIYIFWPYDAETLFLGGVNGDIKLGN